MDDWKADLANYYAGRSDAKGREADHLTTNLGQARLFFHTTAASALQQLKDEMAKYGRSGDIISGFDRAEINVTGDQGREMTVAILVDVSARGAFPHLHITVPDAQGWYVPFGDPRRDVTDVTEAEIIRAIVAAYMQRDTRAAKRP